MQTRSNNYSQTMPSTNSGEVWSGGCKPPTTNFGGGTRNGATHNPLCGFPVASPTSEVWKETRNNKYMNVVRVSPLSSSYKPKNIKVQFDFDASSRAWRANKRATGNGCYSYLDEPIPERNERPQRTCRTPSRLQI